jgi:endoglucanase
LIVGSEGSVFYNKDTVQALKCSWNANLVRAAMGVEEGGYLTNPTAEQAKVEAVVQAAIDLGIYAIIDWHDHNAHQHTDKAVQFFSAISKKYAGVPNVLYEIYNEPLQVSWNDALKPYHQSVRF